AAVFEAQAHGLLGFDVFSKRVASRLLAQFRILERGETEVSERLAQDLLFFCSQAQAPPDGVAPRLAAVRQSYGLTAATPVDYSVSVLGRFDPAVIAQARKRVTAAKDAWSAVAGGEMHRMPGLSEQFALVGESLKKLFPHGDVIAAELQQAIAQTQQANAAPPAPLAMEVATCLLYIEAALEDADFDDPVQAARVQRLAERLAAVRAGRPPEPLEPWMEELYRRVSDRQTMGSVVQELRASLSEAEKQIDQYFRNPADRQVLIPVPHQLSAMRGVLSVLGMDHACAALLRMRDEVDSLAATEIDPQHEAHLGVFDRLASNLGALGFLIDMLSVQPQMAKSLFNFDAATGMLDPVMGRSGAVHAPLAEMGAAPAAASEASSGLPSLIEPLAAPAPGAAATGPAAPGDERISAPMQLDFAPSTHSAQLAQDTEMREIFLEEAREVLEAAVGARAELGNAPDDLGAMTTLRRAFHTLKGSSRMVGLKEFGEAAWACEQLFNTHLAGQRAAPAPLLDFTSWSLGYLASWVDEISEQGPRTHSAAVVIEAAKQVGDPATEPELDSVRAGLAPAAPISSPLPLAPIGEPTPLGLPPDLPSASDLDLRPPVAPLEHVVATEPAELSEPLAAEYDLPEVQAAAEVPPLSFELDLDRLDAPLAHAPAAPEQDAYEHLPTEPLPLAEVIELDPNDAPAGLDLLLDFGEPAAAPGDEEQFKSIGPLRISVPLFNIYLNEADELSRRLTDELAEWAHDPRQTIAESPIALAHSLAGNSATVGFSDLSQLARSLEHAQTRSRENGPSTPEEARLFQDAADEIRGLLHQFAAGFLKEPSAALLDRLAEHERDSVRRLEEAAAASVESVAMPLPEPVAEHAPEQVAEPVAEHAPEPIAPPVPEPTTEPVSEPVAEHRPPPSPWPEPPPLAADSSFMPPETLFNTLGVTEFKPLGELPVETHRSAPVEHGLVDADDVIDAVDAVDAELFPIFDEEAQELLPQLAGGLREWARKPVDAGAPAACMRALHTLKGGARLAGAMRLGEMAHRLEARIEHLLARPPIASADIEALEQHGDALANTLDALRSGSAPEDHAPAPAAPARTAPVAASAKLARLLDSAPTPLDALAAEPVSQAGALDAPAAPLPALEQAPDTAAHPVEPSSATSPDAAAAASATPAAGGDSPAAPASADAASEPSLPDIDWSRFAAATAPAEVKPRERSQATQSAVRVRAPLLDRLVNQAGEVSITRSRIETGVGQIKTSLTDLTENLERLRAQLRDLEFHGEVQMSSRLEAAKAASQTFDPLEFDRFTRFQELTRMMAESVNDVATVQRTLQRSLEVTEDELVAQARMTRDLQDDLLRTRMVEFEGLSDRLYRVVRQAAKETGKSVRLDIVGGSIEVDRGVLDRMTGAFEHLLRNCVSHGIEPPDVRTKAGKDATGSIIVSLTQEANEVGVEFRDDGAGLNLARIRAKGEALGLIAPGAAASDAELANLIFAPGFSTADVVTELAGRGVGMDVVRSEVNAMGGRVETATAAGLGTSFRLILPLTTAVTQVVMLRCGTTQVAVPSTLVEVVRRATPAEIDAAYASASYTVAERPLQFFWLGSLLQISPKPADGAVRTRNIVVIRSAQQRVALHVDEVLGNQEVVVKHLGPQLSRLPGLAGITLLASGAVALIYNPVALATLYGDAARAATHAAMHTPAAAGSVPEAVAEPEPVEAPLVMVVDDSLTVRRVTQRLLQREGYRVVLAKDGLDALEHLAGELPEIVLSDIEMPRMDGFDLVRNMRSDPRLRGLPVIMITSRIAQKHRDYAAELGVDHYLGKPYSEEDLLALIGRYTANRVAAPTTVM
ncbi:MAG TPA: Hpt domain-containing protein, partial [Burkholderiaceae bacterium]